jgi:hypothetical protein
MSTLTKNLFIHAEAAKPGTPAVPAQCYDDGSDTPSPDPGGNPIKWDESGVGTGTGGLPKYAFGLSNTDDPNAPAPPPRLRHPGDLVWNAIYGVGDDS